MSSNNFILLKQKKIGHFMSADTFMWGVTDIDADTGSTNFFIGKFPDVNSAIEAANAYQKKNEVEYGLEVEYVDDN